MAIPSNHLSRKRVMASILVKCPHCQTESVCKKGFSPEGKQRYLCRNPACQRTFILNYTHKGCVPGIDKTIVDMAMNGSGIVELCW